MNDVLLIIFIKVTPFYWGMQAKPPKTPQPEMAKVEATFISKLKKECDCEVKRFFHNYKKESLNSQVHTKYNELSYYYTLNLKGKNISLLDKIMSRNNLIAEFIKDSILLKSKDLVKIKINLSYEDKSGNHSSKNFNYDFIFKNDTLIIER